MGHELRVTVQQSQAREVLHVDEQLVDRPVLLVEIQGTDAQSPALDERALGRAHQPEVRRHPLVGVGHDVVRDLLQAHLRQLAVQQPRREREHAHQVEVRHEQVVAPPHRRADQRVAGSDLLDGIAGDGVVDEPGAQIEKLQHGDPAAIVGVAAANEQAEC